MSSAPRMTNSFFALALLIATSCVAQSNSSVPVPSQLTTAHTIFIANAGGSVNHLDQQAYIDFYRALSATKHFPVTAKPADAELALELTTTSHIIRQALGHGLGFSSAPVLQLNIRDIRTQQLLWSLSEPIKGRDLESVSSRDLSAAVSDLVIDLDALRSGAINDQAASQQASQKR